jgi:hypothetical protein
MIGTARQRIVRAMRRALVLIAVIAAALLGTVLPVAAAAPQPVEAEDLIFGLAAEGFRVEVFAEDNDGDQTASLDVARDGQEAIYRVPATITDHSVAAKFGTRGQLNFRFRPRKCHGGLVFTGKFSFTGENGFIHIDADHASGSFFEQVYTACGTRGPVDPGNVRVVTATGIRLEATAKEPDHRGGRALEVTEYRARGGHRSVDISGFVTERREGMEIGRGAIVSAPVSAFRRDVAAGTATVTPPAPFTGSATLQRHGAESAWVGDLQVPVLGGGAPVALTGPEFQTRLTQEQPFDE